MMKDAVAESCVVLQTAMGLEFEAMHAVLDRVDRSMTLAGRPASAGRTGEVPVVLLKGGWGKVMAASSCQAAVDWFHPSLVVDCGTAGALREEFSVGDLFVAKSIRDGGMQTRWAATLVASQGLTEFLDACRFSVPMREGVLLNLEQTVDSRDQRKFWGAQGFDAVAWEPFGVVKTSEVNAVPVLSMRVISDLADENVVGTFHEHRARFFDRLVRGLRELLSGWGAWHRISDGAIRWSHPAKGQ